ncbi:MAG: hypothetical protein Q7S98_02005, partial [Deltaproteobacteria bacterium]|nr:hypothetical protein [Deltaproteobacteria bacterium]
MHSASDKKLTGGLECTRQRAETLIRRAELNLQTAKRLEEETPWTVSLFRDGSAQKRFEQKMGLAEEQLAQARDQLYKFSNPQAAIAIVTKALKNSIEAREAVRESDQSVIDTGTTVSEITMGAGVGLFMLGTAGTGAILAGEVTAAGALIYGAVEGGAAAGLGTIATPQLLTFAAASTAGGAMAGYAGGMGVAATRSLATDTPYYYSPEEQIHSAIQGGSIGLMQGTSPFAAATGVELSQSLPRTIVTLPENTVVEATLLTKGAAKLAPMVATNASIAAGETMIMGGDSKGLAAAAGAAAGMTIINGAVFGTAKTIQNLKGARIRWQGEGENLEGVAVYTQEPGGAPQQIASRTWTARTALPQREFSPVRDSELGMMRVPVSGLVSQRSAMMNRPYIKVGPGEVGSSGPFDTCTVVAIYDPASLAGYIVHFSSLVSGQHFWAMLDAVQREVPDLSRLKIEVRGNNLEGSLDSEEDGNVRETVKNSLAELFAPSQIEYHWTDSQEGMGQELLLDPAKGEFTSRSISAARDRKAAPPTRRGPSDLGMARIPLPGGVGTLTPFDKAVPSGSPLSNVLDQAVNEKLPPVDTAKKLLVALAERMDAAETAGEDLEPYKTAFQAISDLIRNSEKELGVNL